MVANLKPIAFGLLISGCFPGQRQFTNSVYVSNHSLVSIKTVLVAGHGNSVEKTIGPGERQSVGVLLSKGEIGFVKIIDENTKVVKIPVQATQEFDDVINIEHK